MTRSEKPMGDPFDALLSLKRALVTYLENLVDDKISDAEADVLSAQTSRDSATKSSAGDKHETGRAMMQIEMENHIAQLAKARTLKGELKQLDFAKKHDSVEAGSLVSTEQGNYLMAIGLGKVQLASEVVFVISMASPLGRSFGGKKVGSVVLFQGQKFTINHIV